MQSNLKYKVLEKCNFSDHGAIESLFVEIEVANKKNIIIGTVYRPPNQNIALFLDKLNEIVSA